MVWAARGGGKTLLGAVATMLDLLFKPGVQVRILAGSLEQSTRMFDHLLTLARKPAVRRIVLGAPTRRRVLLRNGSRAEILATSHASIRGIRVQKLRCDEVELIDEAFWQAAQLTTRSATLGGRAVRGAVDALSTMHRPAGLMSRLVERDGVRRFRWTAIDVLERCPPQRPCDGCPLRPDCDGRAKRADGFLRIDDLIQMRRRTSDATWDAEMMCRGASVQHRVYPSFDPRRHVTDEIEQEARKPRGMSSEDDRLDLSSARSAGSASAPGFMGSCFPLVVGGLDFGLRAPLVMLWARVGEAVEGDARLATIEVFDEHHAEGLTLEGHLARIAAKGHPLPAWLGIDPAGEARNTQTGVSDAEVFRRAGFRTRTVRVPVRLGIDAVRRRLDRGTLRVHPRCTRLIAALSSYRYPDRDAGDETPVHDDASHACDALRYLVTCLELGAGEVTVRAY